MMEMKHSVSNMGSFLLMRFLLVISIAIQVCSKSTAVVQHPETRICYTRRSPCFLKRIQCPKQCPWTNPKSPKAKVCYIDCSSPICKADCRNRKPNCSGRGAACLDPRFIGADGMVFYFHGRRNQHFSLVSDHNLQINARFIGLRPPGRSRDYTWIQALGLLFDSHSLTLEATPAATWDDQLDHLKLSYDGQEIALPEGYPSIWESSSTHIGAGLKVERTDTRNSIIVTLEQVVEISVNVVAVTKEEDRIHNYQIPDDDCFAHLEVQFRFMGLSSEVEGVLGRTYQPDFNNPAKPGVAMPVVGGEDKYRTSSLLSADCKSCLFNPFGAVGVLQQDVSFLRDMGMLDCSGAGATGRGIVCKK